jgi:hypothetical protein
MVQTAAGNIGVGTTAAPERLSVAGNAQATRLISTVPTGTAPLAVVSTTTVPNLNADLLDGLNSTAFAPAAGSPNYVDTTGDTMTGVLNLPANGLRVGTNQLVVSGGNVGVGTSVPGSRLTVAGTIESTSGGVRFPDGSIQTTAAGPSGLLGSYDTGFFFASISQAFSFTHNLGTTKILAKIYFATNAAGSDMEEVFQSRSGAGGNVFGSVVKNITSATFVVQTGNDALTHSIDSSGSPIERDSGYLRVIAIGLP